MSKKGCGSECWHTATRHLNGKRLMIAQPGNTKYSPGQKHPQCDEYAIAEYEKLKDRFILGDELYERLKKLKA